MCVSWPLFDPRPNDYDGQRLAGLRGCVATFPQVRPQPTHCWERYRPACLGASSSNDGGSKQLLTFSISSLGIRKIQHRGLDPHLVEAITVAIQFRKPGDAILGSRGLLLPGAPLTVRPETAGQPYPESRHTESAAEHAVAPRGLLRGAPSLQTR
jgi:hypothetical protein